MEAKGFTKILAGTMGYNPNTHELPILWLCHVFGHANILVGLDGAQSKQPPKLLSLVHVM
jgi:hypothetical protein